MAQPTEPLPLQPADVISEATQAIDNASAELRKLSLEIFHNPETAFQETKASKLLSDWLEQRGWTVTPNVYGIETAFEARFSVREGGRTVCFNAEYDALPGVGHACGHNLIATSTLASAVAVETVLKSRNLAGTVVVMGTPAEESYGGKWIMAKNGAWRGYDACVMTHGMPDFSTPVCMTKASWKLRAKFHGKAAHAAGAPWTGRNACDAIVQAYTGIALLRQHIEKSESIQGCILEAGKVPNLIPAYAEGLFSVRAPTVKQIEALRQRVEPIFHGAAGATGCTVELDWFALYEDVVTNETLAEQYRQYMIQHLGLTPEEMLPVAEAKTVHDLGGSSDFGSCSYICPGIQAVFNINATDLPHSTGFREAAESEKGHEEALRAGKANALICIDVLLNDVFASQMKAEFSRAMETAGRSK
ncbi:M20 family metallopeptidase [Aspergillus saccharolyticus JOP 1030-1]|uniref:Peptidase M20 domain-containing protein 2 n=1 Tax=Aspergillus saccharolyticus JOP 1030-1 TaxID=1450539 RepID=A0A318ZN27_9EURO|nr:hypothetical protein BP01DRAFT_363262 [Aspergillus saccharolyticus JOP 1030-1]PYH48085.1 hypothetical protein BP01DRAFT_363262 [Aspergillus saccharolyticus JOP 1030-1]